MAFNRNNERPRPVQVIDHDPLDGVDGSTARSFGKRDPFKRPGYTDGHDVANGEPRRPFEKNGISSYFVDRVHSRQSARAPEARDRSAIRQPVGANDYDEPANTVPYTTLAAVFTLAVALPIGFIWFTEQAGRLDIDPMTTASVSAAQGLFVRDITMTRILKNGTFVVTVTGKITNRAGQSRSLLPLTISLMDEDGKEVQSWRHRTGAGIVKADDSIYFRTSSIDFSGRAETAHVTAQVTDKSMK